MGKEKKTNHPPDYPESHWIPHHPIRWVNSLYFIKSRNEERKKPRKQKKKPKGIVDWWKTTAIEKWKTHITSIDNKLKKTHAPFLNFQLLNFQKDERQMIEEQQNRERKAQVPTTQ